MDVYKIVGRLILEGKDLFDRDVEDTKKKGNSLASSIGKGLATAAKVGAAAVGAAASAVGAMTKASIDSYAEYEQLVGGAQLMFGDAYDYIADKAKNAYSTVQMSQNDYLQQVNGFATGLKTALGGDEQAAAELADKILTAEADIVAATGNSQEAVQNAFNGIMKSNFTMLDNLQIGITPTKEGFQEVIDKVNEWNTANGNATKYQIDNLADCQSALIDYIKMQGLAGYAQDEASKTIQGSLSMTKAAWSNLLTGLADESADIDALVNDLAESAATAAGKLTPRITQILNGVGTLVTQMAPVLMDAIPVLVNDVLPGMLSAGMQLVQTLLYSISSNIPAFVSMGMQLIVSLITGIAQQLPELLPVIVMGLFQAYSALIASVPSFIDAGAQLISGLGQGLMNSFANLFPEVAPWVEQYIFEPIKSVFGVAFELGGEIVSNLWEGLRGFANQLFPGLGDLITGYTDSAVNEASASFQGLTETATSAAASATNAAAQTVLASAELIPVDAETPVSVMAENMQNDTSMEVAAQEAVDRSATQMTDAVSSAGFDSAGTTAMQKFIDGINSMESAVMSAVDAIASAAASKMQAALQNIQNMANSVSIPGYAKGLDYVPYDEFPALLHKGEAVLTAAEAAVWRAGKKSGEAEVQAPTQQTSSQSGITIVQNIQSVPQTPVEFAATTEAYFEQARWSMA